MNVLFGERYKVISEETKNVVKGMYGKTPAEVDQDLIKKAIGDEERVTCRPADLIEPEMDRLTNELGDKAKSVEDVLTYALFPQVATKFFETRGKPQAKEKAAKEVPRKAQPSLQEALESETYKVKVNGTVYEVEVEPLSSGSTVVKRIEEKGVEASPKETSAPTDGFLVKAPLTGDVLRILW
jgi:oxaloacetate decarboxylase alpha subunit